MEKNGNGLRLGITIIVATITMCSLFIAGNLYVMGYSDKNRDEFEELTKDLMQLHLRNPHPGALTSKDMNVVTTRLDHIVEELREIKARLK